MRVSKKIDKWHKKHKQETSGYFKHDNEFKMSVISPNQFSDNSCNTSNSSIEVDEEPDVPKQIKTMH